MESAYQLLCRERHWHVLVPRVSLAEHWQWISKLELPPKIQVFWWRVICMSSYQLEVFCTFTPLQILKLMGQMKNPSIVCLLSVEWPSSSRNLQRIWHEWSYQNLAPFTWANDLLFAKFGSKRESAIIICGMWTLWTSRNKRKHGENSMSLREAMFWARDTVTDLWHISCIRRRERNPIVVLTWENGLWLRMGWFNVTRMRFLMERQEHVLLEC